MLAVASLILTSLVAVAVTAPVPVPPHFFPVDDTDDFFQSIDGNSGEIPLSVPFPFFGINYDSVWVNSNGHVTLTGGFVSYDPETFPIDQYIFAPYWADVNTVNYGKVYYSESQDPAVLQRARNDVNSGHGQMCDFNPTMVFIATWYEVPNFDEDPERNTFQCAMITDGFIGFIMFNYGNITWLVSSWTLGNYPSIGYSAGNTANFYNHPDGNTPNAIDLELTSNTDVTGRWIFRVDNQTGGYGCCCIGGGEAGVNTFDGADLSVLTEGKTEMSLWNADPADQCKYSLYCVTKSDIDGIDTDLHFDWCSFNFGVHTGKASKFSKSLLVAQDVPGNVKVAIRGQGYSGLTGIEFVAGEWSISLGSVTWTLEIVNDNLLTVTPDSCNYQFSWMPNGVDTQWKLKFTGTPYLEADLLGMCGSCDATTVTCSGGSTLEQTPANNAAIATSCLKNTNNDGSGYNGGTRLAGY